MAANKLYFAYGSNMSQKRLEERVGAVTKVGVHVLKRWKLVFNCGYGEHKFANIEMGTWNQNEYVRGVLYELTPKQMRQLDIFEGYPNYYQKVVFPLDENKPLKGIFSAYVCFNPFYKPHPKTKPTQEYINHILLGCQENELEITTWQLQRMKRKGEIVF
jgi:gamma-glutamylcyclotransferase (GGCT)/AIG2-like uncharacterized protein YtfP